MEVRAEQLAAQLARSLAPVYTIHGDEPLLLALEASDAVRAAARRQGYAEREVFEPERSFDWSELRHAAPATRSSATRRWSSSGSGSKVGAQAAEALVDWCRKPSPEALLLVTMLCSKGRWWEAPCSRR